MLRSGPTTTDARTTVSTMRPDPPRRSLRSESLGARPPGRSRRGWTCPTLRWWRRRVATPRWSRPQEPAAVRRVKHAIRHPLGLVLQRLASQRRSRSEALRQPRITARIQRIKPHPTNSTHNRHNDSDYRGRTDRLIGRLRDAQVHDAEPISVRDPLVRRLRADEGLEAGDRGVSEADRLVEVRRMGLDLDDREGGGPGAVGKDLCRQREHVRPRRNRDRRRARGGRGRHGHRGADADQLVRLQTRALRDVGLDRALHHQVGQEIRLRRECSEHLTTLRRRRGTRRRRPENAACRQAPGRWRRPTRSSSSGRSRAPGEHGEHANTCDITPKAP